MLHVNKINIDMFQTGLNHPFPRMSVLDMQKRAK